MPRRQVTILNELGLHARAATRLVECANQFSCEVWLNKDENRADGKSILSLLTLAAGPGMQLEIETRGSDAGLALVALCQLIDSGFGEPEL
jgi:phosphocarrier protein